MASFLSFKDMPIGRKLLVVCLLVTGVMLLLLSALSIAKEARDTRRQMVDQLAAAADISAAPASRSRPLIVSDISPPLWTLLSRPARLGGHEGPAKATNRFRRPLADKGGKKSGKRWA